ncbi:MAG: IS21-like element helper ATPase IstB [Candidatus Saccharimonadales bacterium]
MSALAESARKLESLRLRGASSRLPELLKQAESEGMTCLAFLETLVDVELQDRGDRRLKRGLAMAHFPVVKRLEDFNLGRVAGIEKRDLSELAECSWIDRHENLLLFGPPGLGKTHLAIALGHVAVRKGYSVCYERMTSLVKLLVRSDAARSAQFRLSRLAKANLMIIDEIGYTPIERKEANLFFTFVSDLYERASIVVTSNKNLNSWSELMGDEVMTAALLDRLMHHAKIFSLSGESYRISAKKEE